MRLAFIIQNIIQYYSLKPLLQYIKKYKSNWKFDIYVYGNKSEDDGFVDIYKEVSKIITKDGWDITDGVSQSIYDVCLAPYQDMFPIKYKFLLGYSYGVAGAKPFVLLPKNKMKFHGFIIHSVYDEILNVYGKTFFAPSLMTREVIKKPIKNDKKVLLYLPTYGAESNIENVSKALNNLKDDFKIIAKGHHGTEYLIDEAKKKGSLESIADEYYTPETPTQSLLEKADAVLSDNSGAIFDALYAKVPICIVAREIEYPVSGVKSFQSILVKQGVIPYSKKITSQNIRQIINEALSKEVRALQSKKSDELFPYKIGGAERWIEIIETLVSNTFSDGYRHLHDYYCSKNIAGYLAEEQLANVIAELEAKNGEIVNLRSELAGAHQELESYRNGKLYKLATKVYNKKAKLSRKRSKNA